MIQLFFKIILTMLYMGYAPIAWNPQTTPMLVIDQLFTKLLEASVFIVFCWAITAVWLLIDKLMKKA